MQKGQARCACLALSLLQAGLTSRVWEISDLVGLLEEQEAALAA